jgi:hypothetical protein
VSLKSTACTGDRPDSKHCLWLVNQRYDCFTAELCQSSPFLTSFGLLCLNFLQYFSDACADLLLAVNIELVDLLLLGVEDLIKDFVQVNLGCARINLNLISDLLTFGVDELDADLSWDHGLSGRKLCGRVHVLCLLPFGR